jgi:lipopolysaccharide/colanic/teichoic acid biosynthesis glycosyltransferase
LDLEYIEQQSFLFDLGVLAQAARSLFELGSKGAGELGS